jgi:hypothetical protein
MDDSAQSERTIILDSKVNFEDYKTYWRDSLLRGLPNTLIFWGIFAGGALLIGILLRGSSIGVFFLFFSLLVAAMPVLMTFYNYRNFMSATRGYIASLSESERHFNLIIKPDGNGIEFMHGENFSFISWDSIKAVSEQEKYFTLLYGARPFLIMKSDFQDETDIKLFRNTLADKFGVNAKLLR